MTPREKLYPLKCQPLFKTRIWGGRKLAERFGKALPAGAVIGESWELSDLPEDKTVIANGPLAGWSIDKMLEVYGKQIMGYPELSEAFPLLIKFIDARDVLSVQVHPDATACRRMGCGQPKTECWYIIDAEPGAAIYKGLVKGVDRAQLQAAIESGNCETLLEKVVVRPGECHFIPSGTCHAIGAGLLIAEIQQPSDTTYRLYDWNRLDAATGLPRQLHIEQGLDSVRFDLGPDDLTVRDEGVLVNVKEFNVVKRQWTTGEQTVIPSGKMKVHIIITGKGTYLGDHTPPSTYQAGDTFLIPAEVETEIQIDENTICLEVTVDRTE